MAARFGQKKGGADPYLENSCPLGASWWTDREKHREQGDSLWDQLKEMDEHVARLQDALRTERVKLQSIQQEAELRRREVTTSRLKDKLFQLTNTPREEAHSMEMLNFPPESQRREVSKAFRSKGEESALRVMLERREAELREAMKLRHSLATLLHALRADMEQVAITGLLSDMQAETADKSLDQAEVALGEHVTGGIVQAWRRVQGKLQAAAGTDHDKLLAQMEAEMREAQKLVRLQQQLLEDSLSYPPPPELLGSYFLEEWERLQMRWAELHHQRQTFERERQAFTDAAIRLSHERRDFEQQKADLVKQLYLCDSPQFGKADPSINGRRRSPLSYCSLDPSIISGCYPVTHSPTESGFAAVSGLCERVKVQTPTTPELYSALNLSYSHRSREEQQMRRGGSQTDQARTPWDPCSDRSF
ncbi:afadin- and alpha-actinin-binding protein B isoform X2 [Oryzias melastigma]|uniref:afadin- and alpha-actinin-binding protein B isoform X2 n=1 Tax=Oryzias melastigma TaxID=30732 RepID=UPI000CF7DC82|nr:afadin- and alpha-actinin-binding protein B isoform X2 [Oryzias melastigma]